MSNLVVEAMTGVAVYDPQVSSVDDHEDLRRWALRQLSKGLDGAGLSPTIGVDRIEFRRVHGSPTVDATAAQAWDALPGRLRDLLVRNNLNPANYDTRCFLTDERDYLRTMWAVAVAKAAAADTSSNLPYSKPATSKSKALTIYLLDTSRSMESLIGRRSRIDVVAQALRIAVEKMIQRSTVDDETHARYQVAMFSYSDDVTDLLGGIKTIDEIAKVGLPRLTLQASTQTAKAFEVAEKLLVRELPKLQACPAPLICHMTDGEYSPGSDPEPVVRRIMQMGVPDGKVLVENIFISEKILTQPIPDSTKWPGIMPTTPLANNYAVKLRSMSSPLPESYRQVMLEYGYALQEGAIMLLPGTNPDLVELGFQMSAATPV